MEKFGNSAKSSFVLKSFKQSLATPVTIAQTNLSFVSYFMTIKSSIVTNSQIKKPEPLDEAEAIMLEEEKKAKQK